MSLLAEARPLVDPESSAPRSRAGHQGDKVDRLGIVREMAQIVSRELKAAKEEVKTGREKIKTKIAELGDDQTELKAELTSTGSRRLFTTW